MLHRVIRGRRAAQLPAVAPALLCLVLGGSGACAVALPALDLLDPDASGVTSDAGGGGGGPITDLPDGGEGGLQAPERGAAVRITAPEDGARVEGQRVRITGEAASQLGVASVFVQSGPNVPLAATSRDGFRTWEVEVPVGLGEFVVEAWGWDRTGIPGLVRDSIRLTGPAAGGDREAPTVRILAPDPAVPPAQALIVLAGEAQDDGGVVRMELWQNGERVTDRPFDTEDFFTAWVRPVLLVPSVDNTLTVRAFDALGNQGEDTIVLQGPALNDTVPPTLTVERPDQGATVSEARVDLAGTARDNLGVRTVEARWRPTGDGEPAWSRWETAASDNAFFDWTLTLEDIPPGTVVVQVRAVDVAGLRTAVERTVTLDHVLEYGPARRYRLRLREGSAPPPLVLEVGREDMDVLFTEAVQREIQLVELDPLPLLTSTLTIIKDSCGTRWREDNQNPRHDCTLTELGQSFVGPDGTWRSSPEYALVRLLTMTPANVVVQGTSIEGLQRLADGSFLGITIGGGFNQILSDMLGIPRTSEIVTTAGAVDALLEHVVFSHPRITAEGRMPVSLFDALRDIRPLGEVFGPAPGHPGIVDPAEPPFGQVFDDSFQLRVEARSNLRWFDGVVLNQGKDYLALVEDTAGPRFDDVVELDFEDPETFQVQGLVERPVADMRFQVFENPAFVPSCNGDAACQRNLPEAPSSPASYWALPKWQIEAALAKAGFLSYRERLFDRCYINLLGCRARVALGRGAAPAGWAEFEIIGNFGNPPQDQYVWELISEVGQVALHRTPGGTIPEGEANMAFSVRNIDVGITARELEASIRPFLQSQRSRISELLLGDYFANNGEVDFYYRRDPNTGRPFLYFAAETTPRPSGTWRYTRPGFYRTPDCDPAQLASAMRITGVQDTDHHKLEILSGTQRVFVCDADNRVWRLDVTALDDPREITVDIARRLP
jgi:hypothetical protein